MRVYSRFRCISGLSPKQVASVIFRQFLKYLFNITCLSAESNFYSDYSSGLQLKGFGQLLHMYIKPVKQFLYQQCNGTIVLCNACKLVGTIVANAVPEI